MQPIGFTISYFRDVEFAFQIFVLPTQYLTEILDFIRFLETKSLEERMGTAIASETSLKKDWLRPEEDEAWQVYKGGCGGRTPSILRFSPC